MQRTTGRFLGLCAAAIAAASARAGVIELNAIDRGWYDQLGSHDPTNDNYIVGANTIGQEFRNWFVFDLSAVEAPIASLELILELPGGSFGYASPDPTETYELYSVETDPIVLMSGTGGVAAFEDLAEGTLFGTRVVSETEAGTFVHIQLDPAAAAAADGTKGLWAIGGLLTTLDHPDQFEWVFGVTFDLPPSSAQLRVTTGTACPADLDGDGVVGVTDLLLLLAQFGACDAGCSADLDGDGEVGVTDLLLLLQQFGPCPGSGCPWDVNGDGTVDTSDLLEVIVHLGSCPAKGGCPWDVNGDGVVDGTDVWQVAAHLGPCPSGPSPRPAMRLRASAARRTPRGRRSPG